MGQLQWLVAIVEFLLTTEPGKPSLRGCSRLSAAVVLVGQLPSTAAESHLCKSFHFMIYTGIFGFD